VLDRLEIAALTGGPEATGELSGIDQKDNTRDISDVILRDGQTQIVGQTFMARSRGGSY
jgi:hypothetical protein